MRHINKLSFALALISSAAFAQSGGGGGGSNWLGTPITASADGANTQIIATFPAVEGRTNYLSGFVVTTLGASKANSIVVTVTGTNGPLNYVVSVPGDPTTSANPLIVNFNPPLPAIGPNAQISVIVPAAGLGNIAQFVSATGYLK